MKYWKALVQILFLLSVFFLMSGCTFFAASGGGPLKRSELADWVGIRAEAPPEPEALSSIVKDLEHCSLDWFAGTYSFQEDIPLGAASYIMGTPMKFRLFLPMA